MPFGNRMEQSGQGPGAERGMSRGRGGDKMGGNRPGARPGGNCICPNCKAKAVHQAGVPCYSMNCSKCGTRMVRE